MQTDEVRAFGKLAGVARAGNAPLVQQLQQAFFTRSVDGASR